MGSFLRDVGRASPNNPASPTVRSIYSQSLATTVTCLLRYNTIGFDGYAMVPKLCSPAAEGVEASVPVSLREPGVEVVGV